MLSRVVFISINRLSTNSSYQAPSLRKKLFKKASNHRLVLNHVEAKDDDDPAI